MLSSPTPSRHSTVGVCVCAVPATIYNLHPPRLSPLGHFCSLLHCKHGRHGSIPANSVLQPSWLSGTSPTISSHPLTSLLGFVCVPQTDNSSSYLAVDSTHTAVGRFRSLVRRYGTPCPTISEIRHVVLIVLSSFLRQSCLVFTNVTSALEVFLNVMRYINPRFTYLLTYCQSIGS